VAVTAPVAAVVPATSALAPRGVRCRTWPGVIPDVMRMVDLAADGGGASTMDEVARDAIG
ncbi:MAG: hypothetical protein H0X45_10750, partial [Planctomycetes bacterium]|nr:hypothetical protein [Planctomycetota bacterium]